MSKLSRDKCVTVGCCVAMTLAGCHLPGGGLLAGTGSSMTYYSTEFRPTTITLVDTRTDEPFFSIEIPVGKQLTLQFHEGTGHDPLASPDLMTYSFFGIGTTVGRLRESLSVPNALSRRLDVSYRDAPERPPPRPGKEVRVEELADVEPFDADRSKTIYDE